MSKEQFEVFCYYSQLYPTAIVLYHVGNNYMALGKDACIAASLVALVSIWPGDVFEFPDDDLKAIARIGDCFEVRVIDYRDDKGTLVLPDVAEIKREKSGDY